jgi:hypothetical protein
MDGTLLRECDDETIIFSPVVVVVVVGKKLTCVFRRYLFNMIWNKIASLAKPKDTRPFVQYGKY